MGKKRLRSNDNHGFENAELSDTDPKNCPQCGKPLPADAPGGLCPNCVMAMNLSPETWISTADSAAEKVPPPSPEEMAARLPNFEITECLGRGGMGVVYKAQQKALDREVAIKVLAGEWQDDSEFAKRFEREAKTLAQMSHPNIVTVHDFGEADGLYYIVMEYVDGVNLRDLMSDGNMEPEQALAIVPPICEALEYAHGKGVVHCDIKPENLLLDRDGRVKIADFGIASLVGTTTEASGTPPYMAPEQLSGSVDRRADIYALGVVLYEMLTGERPLKDVVAPSKKVEVNVKIDEMVLRALEKEPERRYQTAREFQSTVEMLTVSATEYGGNTNASSQRIEKPAPPATSIGSAPGFTDIPSRAVTSFATAITFFYAGVILVILVIGLLPFHIIRDYAYLLGVGLVLTGAPFVGVAASNALRRAYASGDPERRDGAAAWFRAGGVVAGLLALPVMSFALFFLQSLMTEQGGWNPALFEAVLVPLTLLGAVLLPACSIGLCRVGKDAAATKKSSNATISEVRPWPRRVFWLLASLFITAPFVLLAMIFGAQAARLGVGDLEAAFWLAGAAVLVLLAFVPPVMALVSLRHHSADLANPWGRRIILLLWAVPAVLIGLSVSVLLPYLMASRSVAIEKQKDWALDALRDIRRVTDDIGAGRETGPIEPETKDDGTEPASAEPRLEVFHGRWLWEEDGTGDRVWLTIPEAGAASMQGTDWGGQIRFHRQFDWKLSEGKLVIALGKEKATGELTREGESLLMETTKDERSVLFQRTDKGWPAIDTDLVVIEDLALQMIVAIREKDDHKLKSLATDRIKDWREALPMFATELRERYRQLVGDKKFDICATESMVKDSLGLVRCTGPEALRGKCLILEFLKTHDGWQNCLLRNSTEDVELREHLSELERQLDAAQLRKDEE